MTSKNETTCTPSATEPSIRWGDHVRVRCREGETVQFTVSKIMQFELAGKLYRRQPDNTFKVVNHGR